MSPHLQQVLPRYYLQCPVFCQILLNIQILWTNSTQYYFTRDPSLSVTSPARGGQNSATSTGVSSPRSTGTVQYSTVQYSEVHYNTVQSPVHRFYDQTDLKDLDNFFNWSMTYRLDSDFPVPYGDIQQV